MKKILLLIVTALFAANVYGQTPGYVYCEIIGSAKMLSNKINGDFDFGQSTRLFENRRLREEKGKVVVFNSMVYAMNWMASDGWEFVQAYIVPEGDQNNTHWVLKKDVATLNPGEIEALTSQFGGID